MMFEVHQLHKYYNRQGGKLHVLKELNLKIEKGEFVSILGPSGAGKSTLLHLLGGLDEPSKGKVLLEDVDIYKIKDSERACLRNRKIGFIFQFYHLLPEFTALENVMLPKLILGLKAAEVRKRAYDLLKQVGLSKRSSHHPGELSGGEQQRVAIARALINEPQILLCDEPTGNLDSATGAKICNLLLALNKDNGYTILVGTHSQEVAKLSSRILFIKDGELVNEI